MATSLNVEKLNRKYVMLSICLWLVVVVSIFEDRNESLSSQSLTTDVSGLNRTADGPQLLVQPRVVTQWTKTKPGSLTSSIMFEEVGERKFGSARVEAHDTFYKGAEACTEE